MGLAVLPARLKDEMAELADALVNGTDLRATETLASHAEWAEGFLPKYDKITKDNVMDILHEEIGLVFNEVLQDAGVYKCTPEGRKAFERYCSCLVAFSGRYKFSQCDGRKRIFSFYRNCKAALALISGSLCKGFHFMQLSLFSECQSKLQICSSERNITPSSCWLEKSIIWKCAGI